jgi:hypothetical protein
MAKFGLYIFTVLLSTIILAVLLDRLYSFVYQHSEPRSKIQYILQLENKEFDIAFFGSSRTENHIDCDLIAKMTGESCINLGEAGSNIDDMLLLMKIALDNNIQFKKVFMQVDYSYNYSGYSKKFIASLTPFLNRPIVSNGLFGADEIVAYKYVPFYRYMDNSKIVGFREFIASIVGKKTKVDLSNGFKPKYGIGEALAGEFPRFFSERNLVLEEMIGLFKKRDTDLQFFIAPYCENVENRELLNTLELRLEGILNYVSIFDGQEELFYNCGHLNNVGAEKFTKILMKDSGIL